MTTRRKRGQAQRISTKKDGAQTKGAAAEVEIVGKDLEIAKHRILRPVCGEGRVKDGKKERVRF